MLPRHEVVASQMIKANECRGCSENCVGCGSFSHYRVPYPIGIMDGDRMVPNTYYRWAENNQAAIESWIAENVHPSDREAQLDWMYENPQVAYQIVNFDNMGNSVKIAKIVNILRQLSYGVLIIIGYQGAGKTYTFAWLVELIHTLKSNKKIYYMGQNMKVPDWMTLTTDIKKVENNSVLAVDEASIRFSARSYQKKAHLFISDLCAIVRHKRLILFFITQRLELIDVNIRRLATAIIFKPVSSLVESPTDRLFFDRLKPFLPRKNNQTLWVDLRSDDKLLYFQPLPSDGMKGIGEAFATYDVTKKEHMFGEPLPPTVPKRSIRPIKCPKCGNEWDTTTTKEYVTCSSCQRKIKPIELATTTPKQDLNSSKDGSK